MLFGSLDHDLRHARPLAFCEVLVSLRQRSYPIHRQVFQSGGNLIKIGSAEGDNVSGKRDLQRFQRRGERVVCRQKLPVGKNECVACANLNPNAIAIAVTVPADGSLCDRQALRRGFTGRLFEAHGVMFRLMF